MSSNTPTAVVNNTTATLPDGVALLAQERTRATFPVRTMTHFLDGDEKMTALKERMMLDFERDPTFFMDDVHDLTRAEIRERIMKRAVHLVSYFENESLETARIRMGIISLIDPGFMTRMGVHYGLFMGALNGSGTPEQVAHWVSKGALTLNGLVGCFAMTELGHGSNVAGVETTATFDPAADEFVIHTPTLTATKWWIGGAAQTATHAVVFAQMKVRGKHHGVQSFIVPLRHIDTFQLRSGISIGDCGAKMGRNGIDNGWIQFTNVRIPRTNMLMRYTKVSREGKVLAPPLAQLGFGALIMGRMTMVLDSADIAKKALTIAIRYGAVRRQFAPRPNAPETVLLDYGTHQARLMPLLAQTYAMHFAGVEVARIYDRLMARLEKAKPGDADMDAVLSALKETHATAAGLKAFCTWKTLALIEECRQCCGGHGYSLYAGLASLYQDFAVQCSWEGDNTVLTLQSGRYLIGCYRDRLHGKEQPEGVAYLNGLPGILTRQCARDADVADLNVLVNGYGCVAAHWVKRAAEAFEKHLKQGRTEDEAYEACATLRFRAARVHSVGYLLRRFADSIRRAPPALQPVLTRLCSLYGLYNVQEDAGAFLQYGYFSAHHIPLIEDRVTALCAAVRTEAISLVDAFNLTDFVIQSPLGRRDGDIYRQYFDLVRRLHPPGQVPPYFERTLKPILKRELESQERIELEEPEASEQKAKL